jgi:hypothetical protein
MVSISEHVLELEFLAEVPSGPTTSMIACVIWMSAREGVESPEG